ncbi:MAG: MarR family transcriptional regulator [Rhodosalinus sp.]
MSDDLSPDEIAEFLVHLGRAARGEDGAAALTPAQWTALRFFARANRSSRTPSAFASFHATTRGTASQTVKSLETKGYLTRMRAKEDRRSVRFELTEAGQDMLARDPLRHLAQSIGRLDCAARDALARALPALAVDVAAARAVAGAALEQFGARRPCLRHLRRLPPFQRPPVGRPLRLCRGGAHA